MDCRVSSKGVTLCRKRKEPVQARFFLLRRARLFSSNGFMLDDNNMEICKTPALRLKALNKHNITHVMYIEMEHVTSNLTKS